MLNMFRKKKTCGRCAAVFRGKYTLCEQCLLYLEGRIEFDPAGITGPNSRYPFFEKEPEIAYHMRTYWGFVFYSIRHPVKFLEFLSNERI
jgi:hypothetical protein